jgi:hypothetical protein
VPGTGALVFAAIGAVHGLAAFALFGVAVRAAMRRGFDVKIMIRTMKGDVPSG